MTPELNLSVILPTVNRGELFRSPLESLLPQLKYGDELIVSINGPREPVETIISDYRSHVGYSSIRVISPPQKLEIYKHWSYAISESLNRWIVFIHDDEIYNMNMLSRIRDYIGRMPDLSLISAGTLNVEHSKLGTNVWKKNSFEKERVVNGKEWIAEHCENKKVNYGSTCYIFNRDFFDSSYMERETRVSDILLMLSQASYGQVLEVPEYWGSHLLHGTNQSWVDYLTPDHLPYWEGVQYLADKADDSCLRKMALEARSKAYGTYIRNALFAALPRNDRRAYLECIKHAIGANGRSFVPKLLKFPAKSRVTFFILSQLMRLIKIIRPSRTHFSNNARCEVLNLASVPDFLGVSPESWKKFLKRAQ